MRFQTLRVILIALFIGLCGLSTVFIARLQFSFNLESFFPDNDTDADFYRYYLKQFKAGHQVITVTIHNPEGVFEREFLKKVRRFTRRCRKVPYISETWSLPTLKDYVYDPFMPIPLPVIHMKEPDSLKGDSMRIMNDPRLVNNLISEDGRNLAVMMSPDTTLSQSMEREILDELRELVKKFDMEGRAYIVGFPIIHAVLGEMQETEFRKYTLIVLLLLLGTMTVLLRRFLGTLVSFLAVFISLILFFGLLGALAPELNLMATLFPILLIIVGTSDVIHLMTKYISELRLGRDRLTALRTTFKEIGLATFMTSLTTAVGFASLYTSKLPPIRTFGLYSALGVFVAYITMMLFGMSMLSFFRAPQLASVGKGKDRIVQLMEKLYRFGRDRTRTILLITALLVAIMTWGISKVSLDIHDVRDLPWRSDVKEAFVFHDKEMKGVNAVEYAIQVQGEHDFYDPAIQEEVEKLARWFEARPEAGMVYSPNVIFKLANRSWHGNKPDYFALQPSPELFEKQMTKQKEAYQNMVDHILSEDRKLGRFSVKIPDIGAKTLANLLDSTDNWIQHNLDSTLIKTVHTGHRYLIDKNQLSLVDGMLRSLGLAFLVVSLFMALIFRNLKLIIVSLIPNIFPLLFAAAVIGFAQLDLDPKISIIFSITFGIAVDDTIHFLAKFKFERDKGHDIETAILHTFLESGKAITLTSLVLFMGFAVLLTSAFPATFVIGLLVSLTLAVAWISDLILTPLCIRWLLKNNTQKHEKAPSSKP